MIYTVTFNPAIDYVVHLQGELKQEGINRNTAEEYQFGGKGINVSNVLRTLGVESEALGFVAGFTGEGLEKGLQASGLHTDFIHVAEGMTRINVKIKAEQEAEINGIGPNITQEDMKQLYQKLDQIRAGDTLVLSGSIPPCLASDTYEKIMAHLADKDIRIVVDATRDLLVNVLKYHPFLMSWAKSSTRFSRQMKKLPTARESCRKWAAETFWSLWRETARCCWMRPEKYIASAARRAVYRTALAPVIPW